MNSKTLRRLAADHAALHTQPLPPNYLFPPSSNNSTDTDDLTTLDILLAGPTHTPFSAGVFKLHLTIPVNYPQAPPTAFFQTPIFHPNVDPQTGGVCVETLKRDWESSLTLRDVLVTICCLLIQPNPDSALNAEAGGLIQEGYEAFARRAGLLTGIHAVVPKAWRGVVREAQMRGQEEEEEEEVDGDALRREETRGGEGMGVDEEEDDQPAAPVRRRRLTTRLRGMAASRRSEGSPGVAAGRRRQQQHHQQQQHQQTTSDNGVVVVPSNFEDPFNTTAQQYQPQQSQQPSSMMPQVDEEGDSSMADADDQENDESRSPTKPQHPSSTSPNKGTIPRRPLGAAIPLGELVMRDAAAGSDEISSSDDEEDEDDGPEYPPSPRKSSPSKSPAKTAVKRQLFHQESSLSTAGPAANAAANAQAESSRSAEERRRGRNITPLVNLVSHPLAADSPFGASQSPRKRLAREAAAADAAAAGAAGGGGGFEVNVDATPRLSLFSSSAAFRRPSSSSSSLSLSSPLSPNSMTEYAGVAKNKNKKQKQKQKQKQNQKNGVGKAKHAAALLFSPSTLDEEEEEGVGQEEEEEEEEENLRRKIELDEELWSLCGGDIQRWNRGDFHGDVLRVKARRW